MKTLAGFALLALFAGTVPADTLDYTVLMSGAPKGGLSVTKQADGARRTTFKFEDRGRGPDLVTRSRYDADGLLVQFDVTGVSYSKQPVAESLAVKDGRAIWKGGADDGDMPAGGYYLASNSNAEDTAAMARALLRAPGNKLALLPAGSASIRKVTTYMIAAGENSGTATLYFISGLDLQPTTLWLDRDGELFASGSTWISYVRKGHESLAPVLMTAQEDALAETAAANAGSLRQVPQGAVVIRNANVFDADKRQLLPRHSVVVDKGLIEAVGPDADIKTPRGARIIDAQGKTLLPGLWEMHQHVQGQHDGIVALLAGITTIRDLGNDPDTVTQLTRKFGDGTLAGPWIIKAALIDKPGEFAGPTKFLVDTPQAMRDTVNMLADQGYVQIKLYSALTPDLVKAGADEAHKRGLRVSGHIPAGMRMSEAVLAGYDEVQHANFWFLNFMSDDIVARTQTPVRFIAPGTYARDLDLSSQPVRDFIALLKQKGTVLDPTLGIFESMYVDWKGELTPWMKPWANALPAAMVRGGRGGGRATTQEERKIFGESFTRMKEMCKLMHDSGIPMVAGTDGSPLMLARELELYAEAGIPAADVLYMATLGPARVMKMDKHTGSIAPGKRADLILIEGNPLERMSDIRRTRLVMKGGAIYDTKALATAAGLTSIP